MPVLATDGDKVRVFRFAMYDIGKRPAKAC